MLISERLSLFCLYYCHFSRFLNYVGSFVWFFEQYDSKSNRMKSHTTKYAHISKKIDVSYVLTLLSAFYFVLKYKSLQQVLLREERIWMKCFSLQKPWLLHWIYLGIHIMGRHIWVKVFNNGPSKICEWQLLKILKGYGLL